MLVVPELLLIRVLFDLIFGILPPYANDPQHNDIELI